jgi:NADPH-dependent glutamate synthase beta subunit-like oxidoreductase
LEDVEMQDLAETPGAIAVADLRRSLEQERESDEENILEDVEMQETTEVPPAMVHSSLVEALPVNEDLGQVSSEKEEADAVVAEPVSEEKGAKGWALRHTRVVAILLVLIVAAVVAAIVVSTTLHDHNIHVTCFLMTMCMRK